VLTAIRVAARADLSVGGKTQIAIVTADAGYADLTAEVPIYEAKSDALLDRLRFPST
jgi:hypothetical protein